MISMSDINSLMKDFDTVSDRAWEEKVLSDLKIDNLKSLSWVDENEIPHKPYYRSSDLSELKNLEELRAVQKKHSDWLIVQSFASSENDLEQKATKALQQGVDQVVITDVEQIDELAKNFEEKWKDIPGLHLQLKKINGNATPKMIFSDPIGEMVKSGKTDSSELEALGELFQKRLNQLKPDNFLLVDGTVYKNAGATVTQELALVLLHAVEYLDQLTEMEYTAEAISRSFTFKLAYGTSYFTEIAKTRAFRFLLSKLYQAYQVNSKVRIWGEAGSYYHAHKDAHTNLIRSTAQVMSAAIGGCDLISTPTFDAWEKSSPLGFRMAKNISLVLKHESNLHRVSDMAEGSYYIENLSMEIANKSWGLFLEMENEATLWDRIKSGSLIDLLKKSSANRANQSMVGVNKYENKDATALKVQLRNENGVRPTLLSKEIKS